jgi:hypothetical protein
MGKYDNVNISGYNPGSGQQQPTKYPFVGEAYRKYGEQAGWVYDPYSDKYRPDPNAQKQLYEQQGLIAKQPGLGETLLPIGLSAGAIFGAKAIGEKIPEYIGSIGSEAKGLLGFGAPEAAGTQLGSATTAATGATSGAGVATPNLIGATKVPGAASGGGLFSVGGIGSAGNGILPVAGAVGAYDLANRNVGPGRGFVQGAASGAAIGSFFGAPGAAIGAGIGGGVGLIKSFFDNPSVKEQVKDRWSGLAKSGDPATQSYAQQYLAYLDSPQAKIDAEQVNTFDGKKEAGTLRAEDVWGGHGMFKTFGSDWLNKYSEDQRRKISQEMINQNLLTSEKGDIKVTDAAKAKQIADQVVSGQPAPAPAPVPAAPPPGTQQLDPNIRPDPNQKPTPMPRGGRGLLGVG